VETFTWDGLDTQAAKQIARVQYDWDKNQLLVNLIVYPHYRNFEKNTGRKLCGSFVEQMKSWFGLRPGSEVLRGILGIGTFFHPQYFQKVDAPKTLDEDIEAIHSSG
jgi:hypothetical protein